MTTRLIPVSESVAALMPPNADPNAEVTRMDLTHVAIQQCWEQYGAHRPSTLRDVAVTVLITKDPAEMVEFQPPHDCAKCSAGSDQVTAFLRDHPDRYVGLANVTYIEVWED